MYISCHLKKLLLLLCLIIFNNCTLNINNSFYLMQCQGCSTWLYSTALTGHINCTAVGVQEGTTSRVKSNEPGKNYILNDVLNSKMSK